MGGDPPEDVLVDSLAMQDAEDPHLRPEDFEHYSIIPDSELPVSLQSATEGLSMLFGS